MTANTTGRGVSRPIFRGCSRVLGCLVLVATSFGVVTATATVAGAQEDATTTTAAPTTTTAPKKTVADPCALVTRADVKSALARAPKALRPIRVDASQETTPSTTTATAGTVEVRSCAFGLLLPANLGGSVQILTSPVRKGVCPPTVKKPNTKVTVANRPIAFLRAAGAAGAKPKLTGVVFAKGDSCVSVVTALSNARSVGAPAYRALVTAALRRR